MDELEKIIKDIINEKTEIEKKINCIDPDLYLKDLGLNSLNLSMIFIELEQKCNFDLFKAADSENFTDIKQIKDIISFIKKYQKE